MVKFDPQSLQWWRRWWWQPVLIDENYFIRHNTQILTRSNVCLVIICAEQTVRHLNYWNSFQFQCPSQKYDRIFVHAVICLSVKWAVVVLSGIYTSSYVMAGNILNYVYWTLSYEFSLFRNYWLFCAHPHTADLRISICFSNHFLALSYKLCRQTPWILKYIIQSKPKFYRLYIDLWPGVA